MGFLKFLFYFILIILTIRLLFRIFFPLLLKYLIKKHGGSASFTWSNFGHEPKPQEEGKVTINTKPASKTKIVDKDEGDYVNFEEVK